MITSSPRTSAHDGRALGQRDVLDAPADHARSCRAVPCTTASSASAAPRRSECTRTTSPLAHMRQQRADGDRLRGDRRCRCCRFSISSRIGGRLISAITLRAPSRLASMAERMLASSALVSAANTSALSMFSSISSSSSAASPCSTMVLSQALGDRAARARIALDQLDLVGASRAARQPEADVAAAGDDHARAPASSARVISFITARMSSRAAMKNTSSSSSITVSPSGSMLRPSR